MNSRGVQVFAKRDEPKKTAGNGRRPQYQSMVQARELELATPSFGLLVFPVINRPGVGSKDRRLSSQCSKW